MIFREELMGIAELASALTGLAVADCSGAIGSPVKFVAHSRAIDADPHALAPLSAKESV
jgi:hypothetical protein